jgi:hypothetical protein
VLNEATENAERQQRELAAERESLSNQLAAFK